MIYNKTSIIIYFGTGFTFYISEKFLSNGVV